MWVSHVSGGHEPKSCAAVWWLAYEPSGAINNAARVRVSTSTGTSARTYTPWKIR